METHSENLMEGLNVQIYLKASQVYYWIVLGQLMEDFLLLAEIVLYIGYAV